ncbi:MAG TPA: amidohydrolase family protein [Puia sp.]|nr:amidohydrolase family protein [Puia sp.]
MNVIDTHIHVWDLDRAEYPWLKGDTSILNRTYEIEELEEERMRTGVTHGVLVQAAYNLEDTDWMIRVAETHPWIAGVVGWLPLEDPSATAALLERDYVTGGLLKGVRHLIHDEADTEWLLQDTVLESLGLLAARDISYDIVGILPAHIATALKVAARRPGLRMIFDHVNQPPPPADGPLEDSVWATLMKEAAANPNFYVKISGLATAARKGRQWKADDLEPGIAFAARHFGVERICCGGDWPVSLLAGGYADTWNAYRTIIARHLNEDDQAKLLSQNAERFYKLAI